MTPRNLMAATVALLLLHASAVAAQDGAALYGRDCAACHDKGVDRAPSREALRGMTAERVLAAMESGAMISMASRVNGAERRAIAQYVTGKTFGPRSGEHADAADMCSGSRKFTNPLAGNDWNGWGNNTSNTRFQSTAAASFTAGQVPRLKVKWAFGFPGDLDANAQPAWLVAVSSSAARAASSIRSAPRAVASIGPTRPGAVRGGMTVAPSPPAGVRRTRPSSATGRQRHAVNAATGALLWTVEADPHPVARIVGSVVFHDGRLYVPVASAEETAGAAPTISAARFAAAWSPRRGQRRQAVEDVTIDDEAKPKRKNAVGTQLLGPSGARCLVEPRRGYRRRALYITTGDNYSAPANATSDAFMALDLATGKVLWTRQMTAGDAWNTACRLPDKTNCPDGKAPDFDFASPPILVSLANGKRALVAGQKSGMLHAVDPDDSGAILWQARLGSGGTIGGVQWGSAADGTNVYVALSDIVRVPVPNSLGSNADPKAGGGMFAFNVDRRRAGVAHAAAAACAHARPLQPGAIRGCDREYPAWCSPGRWMATCARIRRQRSDDLGLRQRRQTYKTVNGVQARGGSLDGPGPAIAGGMMFVSSGYARAGAAGQRAARVLRGRQVGSLEVHRRSRHRREALARL